MVFGLEYGMVNLVGSAPRIVVLDTIKVFEGELEILAIADDCEAFDVF